MSIFWHTKPIFWNTDLWTHPIQYILSKTCTVLVKKFAQKWRFFNFLVWNRVVVHIRPLLWNFNSITELNWRFITNLQRTCRYTKFDKIWYRNKIFVYFDFSHFFFKLYPEMCYEGGRAIQTIFLLHFWCWLTQKIPKIVFTAIWKNDSGGTMT